MNRPMEQPTQPTYYHDRWTVEEEAWLVEHAPQMTWEEVAAATGRRVEACRVKYRRLRGGSKTEERLARTAAVAAAVGPVPGVRRRWSEVEVEALVLLVGRRPQVEVAAALRRSPSGVKWKVKRLRDSGVVFPGEMR